MQSMLSTEFMEADVIDPRYYTDSGIAEYCVWTEPGIVIAMTAPPGVKNGKHGILGIETAGSYTRRELLSVYDVQIDATDSKSNYYALPTVLEQGNNYQIKIPEISLTGEETDGISLVLYNLQV